MAAPFKNQFLSYTRLSRFERCPKSFELHYVRKEPSESNDALHFGGLMHRVLEEYFRSRQEARYQGPVVVEDLQAILKARWPEAGLSSLQQFEEAAAILRDFVQTTPDFDHARILGIEVEFAFDVGPFTVKGYIDRIDRLDDGGIEVVDYKTNRAIFSEEEVAHDLQLSIYALAVSKLFPDAKHVKLSLQLLRHGFKMSTTRTPEQLAAALDYVEVLGRQTEEATSYPARLNTNCVYCDHRRQCPAYARALLGDHEEIPEDLPSLERVAREREQLASVAKIAYARKARLEGILKTQLRERDELVLGGVRYWLGETTRLEYPRDPTIAILAESAGEEPDALAERLLVVDKGKVDELVKGLRSKLPRAQHRLLQTKLEGIAERSVSPRFNSRKVAER